jgi:predicted metal-dependent peptidase
MTETPREYNLNRDAYSLMKEEPFYARIMAKIDKVSSLAIPTAGVRYNADKCRFEFVYNPRFFASLDRDGRLDVIRHECAHIFLDHCTTRSVAPEFHKMWNIATDLAINSYLDYLPEFACKPGVGPFAEWPAYKAADWYFNKLKSEGPPKPEQDDDEGQGDECENGTPGEDQGQPGEGADGSNEGDSQGGSGGGEPGDTNPGSGGSGDPLDDYQFDDHSGWGDEGDDSAREFANEKLREIVREAIEGSDGTAQDGMPKGWGSVHVGTREELRKNFKKQTINWRSVLRMFVQSSQPNKRRSSIRRLSRRYPYVHPGRRTDRVANIAISIDQSGSVSSTELQEFYNELESLSKLASFTVIPFDDKVFEDGITEWKRGETHEWRRYTCGGTNFDAPTKFVNDRPEFDAHIIMTDMYAPKPKSSRVPRMWVASEYNARRPYFQPSAGERILSVSTD